MHFTQALTALTAFAGLTLAVPTPRPASQGTGAAFTSAQAGEKIPDNYIVVFKPDVDEETIQTHIGIARSLHANRLVRRDDSSLAGMKKQYRINGFRGYSGSFDEATIKSINASAEVDFIEADSIVTLKSFVTEKPAPSWGLSRISSTTAKSSYAGYTYDSTAGVGVTVYVIDTGIQTNHADFEGRAKWGYNAVDNLNADGAGHGTHVAGTIGGRTYGVAKKANLIAVKVLDEKGQGATTRVIEGMEWVVSDAKRKGKQDTSVANMSLGGRVSRAIDAAAQAGVSAGITFAVAAGNEGRDASTSSPAAVPSVLTVGATDADDSIAVYSNYGPLIDVFAPGTDITSTWIGASGFAINTMSGTSMATPHVAGLAAYLIALEGLSGAIEVTARIKELAVQGTVKGVGRTTTSALINNGIGR
ncbi:cuticle-degrading serine protease [Choiromyces venosus 120613-1]|uniref:Cuticle-degrading serine protease n=1 Tax=Choiromyces venosus 120613-1 TaxID=1336337 RepID=A0A3N4J896_9PEZI|nr:cuticle-degrading serine protease [Choiromyces venosus 120613-1]